MITNFYNFYNFINESLTDKIYHFTYLSNVYHILSDNKFNLSPVFGTKADLEINSGKLYALSLTSSRNSEIGYAASLSKVGLVRISLDGSRHDSLKNDKKLIDFINKKLLELKNYYKDTIYNDTGSNFEYTYKLSSFKVKDDSGWKNDTEEYDDFTNNNYDSSIQGDDLHRIIGFIINDMSDFFDIEIEKIKNEQYKQWNT